MLTPFGACSRTRRIYIAGDSNIKASFQASPSLISFSTDGKDLKVGTIVR
ncbi:MAG TPA: hypothetical protein PLP07_01340 [Pyrinomonadaceae bacterium]|nr:hypothetical protein [Chloracidobacterium sp.]HQX54541.1 hypothetical protein [Pyrinomonadaceae bacterium]MBK7802928.1 hypothetical protein [Chloracidobacterium sp.]MBK9438426.1 hypothetical protein [Chloracidobacterium sp.]MBL0240693.1 hypothetical protein [Chloracidobacterium sp.]